MLLAASSRKSGAGGIGRDFCSHNRKSEGKQLQTLDQFKIISMLKHLIFLWLFLQRGRMVAASAIASTFKMGEKKERGKIMCLLRNDSPPGTS